MGGGEGADSFKIFWQEKKDKGKIFRKIMKNLICWGRIPACIPIISLLISLYFSLQFFLHFSDLQKMVGVGQIYDNSIFYMLILKKNCLLQEIVRTAPPPPPMLRACPSHVLLV